MGLPFFIQGAKKPFIGGDGKYEKETLLRMEDDARKMS